MPFTASIRATVTAEVPIWFPRGTAVVYGAEGPGTLPFDVFRATLMTWFEADVDAAAAVGGRPLSLSESEAKNRALCWEDFSLIRLNEWLCQPRLMILCHC